MLLPLSFLLGVLGLGAIVLSVSLFVALGRRHMPGAAAAIGVLLGSLIWVLGAAGLLLAPTLELKTLAWKFQVVGIVLVPPAILLFARQYARPGERPSRRLLTFLAIEPILALGLAWTNELHNLYLREIWLQPVGDFTAFGRSFGPMLLANSAYAIVLELVGAVFLASAALRSGPLAHVQVGALLAGVLLPTVAQLLWLIQPERLLIDPAPFTLVISGAVLGWSIFGLRLLEITPFAREAAFQAVDVGIVVVDAAGRIVDVNGAAQRLLGGWRSAVGSFAATVFAAVLGPDAWVEARATNGIGRAWLQAAGTAEERWIEVKCDALARGGGGGLPMGYLVLLRDVTARRQTAVALEEANHALALEVAARGRLLKRGEMLLRAARRAATERKPERLLTDLAVEAAQVVDADAALVARYFPHDGSLVPLDQVAAGSATRPYTAEVPLSTLRLAIESRTVIVHEVPGGADAGAGDTLGTAAALPLLHEGCLLGAMGVLRVAPASPFSQEDLEVLELIGATAASALVATEEARLSGVLLAARTAQHELNNRLALTSGYAELLANDPGLSERARGFANEARRGAAEAGQVVAQLSRLTRVAEIDWGANAGTTINLEASIGPVAVESPLPSAADSGPASPPSRDGASPAVSPRRASPATSASHRA